MLMHGAGDAVALPPEFVSASSASRPAGTTAMSVAAPSSISDGNGLYLFVIHNSNSANAATCAGFTQIAHSTGTGGTITILRKPASGESGAYSVASTTGGAAQAHILNYSEGEDVEDVAGTFARVSSATSVAPSITALSTGALLAIFAVDGGRNVTTPPSGMTQRAYLNTTVMTIAIYDLSPSATGSTGTKTLIWNSSGNDIAQLTQIK